MAHVADHLSVSALEQQYRSCTDVTATRHVQTIWLLAKGHTIAEVSATASFARRWVERLLARYNAQGPQALGDLRRRNGTSPSVLRPDLLDKLTARLREPPPEVACGPARRWRAGWRVNSGSLRFCPNAAGRRSRRSAGRGRSRAPATLPRPRRRSARRLKKARAGRRRGAGPAPGQADRSLGDRRAPHRAEADPAPGVGAPRPAAHRAWPPPLQGVVRHRLRAADLGRDLLVGLKRHLEAVLCRAAGAVCARGRGGTRAHPRA